MFSLAAFVAEHEEELAPLIAPPLVFAGIAVAVFVLLGFITWSYRDVSNRQPVKHPGATNAQGDHTGGHSGTHH